MRSISFRVTFGLLVLTIISFVDGGLFYRADVTTEASSDILVEKWKKMEDGTIKTMQGMVKQLMPMLSNPNSTGEISDSCTNALYELILGLTDLKLWAHHMLDAIGKPEGGQLEGTASFFGDYRECLDIIAPDEDQPGGQLFVGQYCIADLRPPLPARPKKAMYQGVILDAFQNFTPKTELIKDMIENVNVFYDSALRVGLCIPSACSKEDLKVVLSGLAESNLWHVDIVSCEVKEELHFDTIQIVIAGLLAANVLIALLASFIDYKGTREKQESATKQVLMAFSIQRNYKRFVADSSSEETSLRFLNGMRFLSMTWVVVGHVYLITDFAFHRQVKRYLLATETFPFQVIINGFISVDTFFFIGTLLLAYFVVKLVDQKGKKVFKPIVIHVRRIARFLPPVFLIIGLTILLPLISSGPLWKSLVDPTDQNCRERWWANILFVNNLFTISKACVPHTWYLAVDLQLIPLAFLYFYLLFKKPIFGHVLIGLMIIGSVLSTGIIIYINQDPPAIIFRIVDQNFLVDLPQRGYMLPSSHLSIYAIGLAVGTYFARFNNFKISTTKQLFGWLIATVLAIIAVYGVFPWNAGYSPSPLFSALYGGFYRTIWGLALTWMSLMCFTGRGGLINSFLSWNGFVILNRTSFMIYLIHILVYQYLFNSYTGVQDTGHRMMVWHFIGTLFISFVLSVIIRILYEGPFIELEKTLFSKLMQKRLKETKEAPPVPPVSLVTPMASVTQVVPTCIIPIAPVEPTVLVLKEELFTKEETKEELVIKEEQENKIESSKF